MITLRAFAAAAVAAAFLTACATTAKGTVGVPRWVSVTPQPTTEYTFFVGSGSDTEGNIAAANGNAVHSLVGDVTRYLGVSITSKTTVETLADLKSFRTHVTESIRETSSATVGDFSIIDRWIEREGNQVTVFLLGRYLTQGLEAEKRRLQALERERTDAVAVPEKRADAFLARGKVYAAAGKYLQAALAAAGTKVANAEVRFARVIEKAGEAVSRIRLSAVTDNLDGIVGSPLPRAFLVVVTDSAGGDTLADVPFRVSYPVLRANGRTGSETMRVSSNAAGELIVNLPPTELIGRHSVTVALDLSAELSPLLRVPSPKRVLVTALEQRVNSVRLLLHYSTTSPAASIPTGVLVVDLDRGGKPIPEGDDAAAGIVGSLTQAGYHILPIPWNPSFLGTGSADLAKILHNNFGDRIKRAVIGSAKISGFERSKGNYIVKVTGSVRVVDLATGRVLFSTTRLKLSRANRAASAISAAFKGLGTSIGDEIRNRLQ